MRWFRLILPVAPIALSLPLMAPAIAQKAAHIPSYPSEVSLVDEGAKGFVYRETDNNLRLYTYDPDRKGMPSCTGSCASAWPPLLAQTDAKAVGQWTIVPRGDGNRQWAFGGKPIYTRFHDAPNEPTGDGVDGKWHLVPHTKNP